MSSENLPSENLPPSAKGLRRVTKEEFFARIYSEKLNVHPTIVSEWSDGDGYVSEWRTLDASRSLYGVSDSNRYWLAP